MHILYTLPSNEYTDVKIYGYLLHPNELIEKINITLVNTVGNGMFYMLRN